MIELSDFMITARESEILKILKEDPLISQNELAEQLQITRASAATHIHNLTKKGYIKGRGYILSEPAFISVIGGINMDVFGISNETLIDQNSNPGKITFALGGAGRNIALNLTKLGVSNYFISVFGNDVNGEIFVTDSAENNMDITHCELIEGERTSTYLYVNEPNGQVKIGIDDMDIYQKITPEFLNNKLELINSSQYCIVDTNIPKESIEWLCDHCKVPIIIKTVSINKNYKVMTKLDKIHTLILSHKELMQLTELNTIEQATNFLLDKGVRHVIVYSPNHQQLHFQDSETSLTIERKIDRIANTNGAKAALTATITWGLMQQMNWKDILEYAYNAAVHCMETYDAVNTKLSVAVLERETKA